MSLVISGSSNVKFIHTDINHVSVAVIFVEPHYILRMWHHSRFLLSPRGESDMSCVDTKNNIYSALNKILQDLLLQVYSLWTSQDIQQWSIPRLISISSTVGAWNVIISQYSTCELDVFVLSLHACNIAEWRVSKIVSSDTLENIRDLGHVRQYKVTAQSTQISKISRFAIQAGISCNSK